MEMGKSVPARRLTVIALAALLALSVAFAADSASASGTGRAVVAKKKCKKKGKKSASAAKKKCKKKKTTPVVVPPVTPPPTPPPAPLALTDAQVITRVSQKANQYCVVDPDCIDSGYYYEGDPSTAACDLRTTYVWACYGWNDEDNGTDPVFTCAFREIVERSGFNSVTSHQDLNYGTDGWNCGV